MYIDFKLLKQQLEVENVLNYFDIKTLKRYNGSFAGRCPLHPGDNPTAFHFNIDRKIFNCFTHCGGGNILDFIAKFKKVSIHQAALIAHDILGKNTIFQDDLGFRLKLDTGHSYIIKRNITLSTARYFGIGYCDNGYFKNRIAIPIYSDNNTLVAYAGRAIDDTLPKYLFPKNFKKLDYLFNFNRIVDSFNNQPIFIVEGFFDVLNLFQLGFSAIAIMGCSISDTQLKLFKSLDAFYYLLLDGDNTGRYAASKISKLFGSVNIRFNNIMLTDNLQPDNLSKSFLDSLLARF